MDPQFPQKETGVKLKMYCGIELQSTLCIVCLSLTVRKDDRNTGPKIYQQSFNTFDWTSSYHFP